MEKINIAELLKDCPKGMELDSPVWDNIVFDKVYGNNIIIFRKCCNSNVYLSQYGELHDIDGKCIIFPKGKTTWEGFYKPFEPGDIVITNHNEHAFIYSGENDNYWECYCGVYCGTRDLCINSKQWSDKKHKLHLATEEEKEKLFQVIKDNGYEWNVETKTLKKSIKLEFKDEDIVYIKTRVFEHIFIFKTSIDDRFIEGYATLSDNSLYLDGYPVCETNDVKEIRLATEEERAKLFDAIKARGYYWNNETKTLEQSIKPKFKVGNKIREKGDKTATFTISDIDDLRYYCGEYIICNICDQDKYKLVPDKFDITTLKPFESRVLVRDHNSDRWKASFWGCLINSEYGCKYDTTRGCYKQCIPYEGNEHLLGKSDSCNDYYKTWINEKD